MNDLKNALSAEWLKNKHSKIKLITLIAFSLAPVFGGVLMMMMKGNGYAGLSGALKTKAILMSFKANWESYLGLLTQAMAVGGIIVYGFTASWLFGREYSEHTAKDMLALPISRSTLLHAKFIFFFLWSLALALWNLILVLAIGTALQLPGWQWSLFYEQMRLYVQCTIFVTLLNTPTAFFALLSRGYLAPLGVVVLAVILAQIMGVMGFGIYFPWAIPAIYAGSAGAEMQIQIGPLNHILVYLSGIAGYVASLGQWNYSDQ